ncbi:hypothetical protein TNCV_2722891 [Trichonephila clavipes]|nr:hypothetical protein TNCV_2722891 [Trichonephila clavipes]
MSRCLLEQLRATAGAWTYSMQRAENIREPMNLKPTHVLTIVRCRFLRQLQDMTAIGEPNPMESRVGVWGKIYFYGWRRSDRFFSQSGRERLKRYR